MKSKFLTGAVLSTVLGVSSFTAHADEIFTGDTRLACEAILCLSSGTTPSECRPSLKRYYSISAKKLRDTIKKRGNFLKICPTANQTPQMASLVNALSAGAGRCDADSLNRDLRSYSNGRLNRSTISDRMPDYCQAYSGHAYTNLPLPYYQGRPNKNGRWVNP